MTQAAKGQSEMSEEVIEEFGEACKASLRRQFAEGKSQEDFSIRVSTVGKPLCQQQMAQGGAPVGSSGY
ncbi:MAG: hypothetical protein IIB81_03805, partial [Nanoarchaeota archaeon]|nr:hypothetical protein [Nanoarchaeota archaeon]